MYNLGLCLLLQHSKQMSTEQQRRLQAHSDARSLALAALQHLKDSEPRSLSNLAWSQATLQLGPPHFLSKVINMSPSQAACIMGSCPCRWSCDKWDSAAVRFAVAAAFAVAAFAAAGAYVCASAAGFIVDAFAAGSVAFAITAAAAAAAAAVDVTIASAASMAIASAADATAAAAAA